MPRRLPPRIEKYLMAMLGPVRDEIIIGHETAACIRDRAAKWGSGYPKTVDELADIIGECLCPPFSVTQAIMAYMESVEGYKWLPPEMRRRERKS